MGNAPPKAPPKSSTGVRPDEYTGPMRGRRSLDEYDLARQEKFNNEITGGNITSLEVGDILQRKDNAPINTKYKHPGYTYGIVHSKEEGNYVQIYGEGDTEKMLTRIGGSTIGAGRTLLSDFVMIKPYDTRRLRKRVNINEQQMQNAIEKRKEETRKGQAGIIAEITNALNENKVLRAKFTYDDGMLYYANVEGNIINIDTNRDPVIVTVEEPGKFGVVNVSIDRITIIHAGGKRKEKKSRKNRKRKNSRRTRNKT